MATSRVLAFAAARGRIGSVVLDGDKLIDWRISETAAKSVADAVSHAERLFADFTPTVVVTEEIEFARHKSQHTLSLIAAIAKGAERKQYTAVSLPREHRYPNKYAEADALVNRFPELQPWKPPKRCFYDNEPRNTVLFEALSLAIQILMRH